MTNVLDFLIRLKTVKKGGAGSMPQSLRDALFAEYLGPAMHAKLNHVSRTRRKLGRGL